MEVASSSDDPPQFDCKRNATSQGVDAVEDEVMDCDNAKAEAEAVTVKVMKVEVVVHPVRRSPEEPVVSCRRGGRGAVT